MHEISWVRMSELEENGQRRLERRLIDPLVVEVVS